MRNRILLAVGVIALSAAATLFSSAPAVAAHGGGLDGYGCHNDRKAGTYHCHRGPCAGKGFDSQTAMRAAACSQVPKK